MSMSERFKRVAMKAVHRGADELLGLIQTMEPGEAYIHLRMALNAVELKLEPEFLVELRAQADKQDGFTRN